jgi:hypothetical protein
MRGRRWRGRLGVVGGEFYAFVGLGAAKRGLGNGHGTGWIHEQIE